MPPVVGIEVDDTTVGSLGCWDNVTALAPDGHDVENDPAGTTYRITGISPAPGTLVGSADVITLHVVQVNPDLPSLILGTGACDWITVSEAANALGGQRPKTLPIGDEEGAVTPSCTYDADGKVLTSALHLPGSFPVDAQAEFSMGLGTDEQSTDLSGLPGPAKCITTQSSNGSFRTVKVLLDGDRIYLVEGHLSCDTLQLLAHTAIARIGT